MAERSLRKSVIGHVVTDRMDKSVTVRVERRVRHKLYHKFMKQSTKFMAHDENNDAKVGDRVRIQETRPLSRNKRWRVVEIIEKAK